MALAMARPWKHPKTGVYWLRKAVPAHLRPLLGKREEKRTLRTRDPAEAKRLHAAALADIESHWARLAEKAPAKPVATLVNLSEREAHARAAWMYDFWLEQHRENPSAQAFWRTDLADVLWKGDLWLNLTSGEIGGKGSRDFAAAKEMERWCRRQAETLLIVHDLEVDEESAARLEKAIAAAAQRASLELQRLARGEPEAMSRPVPPDPKVRSATNVTFDELLKGWAAEKRPAERTIYEWGRILRQLETFLKHSDARRLTADAVVAWKESMIGAGLKPKTIRDGKLAPVRAILQWAVQNRKLATNAAERVSIDLKSKLSEAKRSFTEDEARIVLFAAARESDPVRHWVPLLCAYSGARLSEVCQLRGKDVRLIDGIWCLAFDPEAGSLKNSSSERAVPLHPAVVQAGFLEFARGRGDGPLFTGLPPDKFGKRGGNGTKVLGRWVRSLGLADPRLSPNHSWRHRLRTMARRHGLAPDIADAITGHSRKSVADQYGEYEISAVYRELCKIPTIE